MNEPTRDYEDDAFETALREHERRVMVDVDRWANAVEEYSADIKRWSRKALEYDRLLENVRNYCMAECHEARDRNLCEQYGCPLHPTGPEEDDRLGH